MHICITLYLQGLDQHAIYHLGVFVSANINHHVAFLLVLIDDMQIEKRLSFVFQYDSFVLTRNYVEYCLERI